MNTNSLSRLLVTLGTAFCILAATLPARSIAQTAPVLRIALIPSDIAAEGYYAKDMGFFKKAGYDVELIPITSGAAISAAVASGAADVGFSNVVSLSIAHEHGLPFTLLAPANLHLPTQVTAGILTVTRSSPIRTARDLNGKTVAINGLKNISEVAIRAWMDKNGGDPLSVKFTEMPLPAMPDAVRSGRVDAASIDAANEQELTKPDSDLRRLANVFDSVSPRFSPSVWFATSSWVAEHPAAAKTFVVVMAQTAAWANANHSASAEILAKYLSKPPQDIDAVTRAAYAVRLTPDLVQPSIDDAVKYGEIKAGFPAADLINPIAR